MSRGKGVNPLLPQDASARQRRAEALELRVAGLRQAEIARRVGVTQPQVSRMIKQALHEREVAGVDQLRAVEALRIDGLHAAFWPSATERRDVGAAHVILKASDRRSKLLGLDQGGEGGADGVRHEYFAYAMVDLAEAASDELERWETAQREDIAWQQSHDALLPPRVVTDATIPLPPGSTYEDAQRAVTAAVDAAIGPRPDGAPRLILKIIIAERHYRPVTRGRDVPEPVNG